MKKTPWNGRLGLIAATAIALSACGGGGDDNPPAPPTASEPPVTDRFAPLPPTEAEPAYPTEYARQLAAATKNAGGDQALLDTWQKYYCMYPENNQTLRQSVRDDDARLPVTQIFDDVWYVGSRYVGQYVFKSASGFLLLDALNNAAEVQQYDVPALTALGVSANLPVKDLLLTHGHGDHDGGALEIKTTYGPRVILGSADAAGKTYAPFVIDSSDPNPIRMTLGGREVTLLSTPGHTPGSVTSFIPAFDKGKEQRLMVVGGSAMPTTVSQARSYLDGVERSYKIAKEEGVTGTVHPHPVFDGSQRNMVAINATGMPAANPFVVGNSKVLRATAILRQCSAANVVKVDATAVVPVWRVTKLELPTDGTRVNDISARLSSPWGPVVNQTVAFKGSASGKTCNAVTNAEGIARCTAGQGFTKDDTVTATFEGANGTGFIELASTATAAMQAN